MLTYFIIYSNCYIYIFVLGQTVTTVGEEKTHNPRFTKSLDEFIEVMNNLNMAYPKNIG